ncbi:uncharacterized protein LOC109610916 isoform X2 [Ooceraea biroi]|uniref:uncharacterized protein LOC109610916 isoform X2 n=1 Tax=Ooceraea biroi TaxID=2015173 RepID=UPI0009715F17|nr:uncharacterized protein LOC109610916 isoform X2 [Ooceraea biroi]
MAGSERKVQEALTSLKDQHQKDLLHAWSIRQIDQGRRQLPNDHSSRSRKDDGFLHKSGERCRFWSADSEREHGARMTFTASTADGDWN